MKKIVFAAVFFSLIVQLLAQPSSFSPRGIGGGGALFFPTINPANDNEYYVSCDMSQLFHTIDFGTSYAQSHFSKLQVFNTSTYEFTSNPLIAYSVFNDGNNGYPVRTLDGGNTWQPLPSNPLMDEKVYTLKADYANPDRFVMGYYGAIYITNNRGASFSLVKQAANNGVGLIVAGTFFDGNTIVIATNEGIFHSTNGGTSFTPLSMSGFPTGQGIWQFAAAKVGTTTRFFCITSISANTYNGIMPWDNYQMAKGVYSLDYSPTGTNTWVAKATNINFANDFVMYVGMAKNDINTVYLGGADNALGAPLVYKTTNAGVTWTKVFKSINNQNIITGWSGHNGDRQWSYGETCFGITVAPNNANKVVFGDFGFIHNTADGGTTWQQAYVATTDQNPANAATPTRKAYHSIGLENTTAWQLHFQDANNFFACFSDIRGIRSTDAGVTWSFNYTGNAGNSTYRIVKNPTTNALFAATSGIHDMYQSTRLADAPLDATDSNGKVTYSTDGGATWIDMKVFSHPVFWLAIDPTNAQKLYASVIHYGAGAGQGGVWVTSNANSYAAATWTKLPNPPRTEGHPASLVVLNDGKLVATYSGRRTSTAFTASSGVFIYNPTTNAWTDVSDAGMQYWTKDIIINPSDATQNTWYVAVFSGWGGAPNAKGGLYKTTNRGTSWTKLTGTQFDRVTSLTFNPLNVKQAFLTTETQGLWFSTNMDTTTPTWSLVTAYPFRQPERVFFNPFKTNEVWITSFGNGLKVGNMAATGVDFVPENTARVFPNPTSHTLSIERQNAGLESYEIMDLEGRIIQKGILQDKNSLIDIQNLPHGLWFLKINKTVVRFVKEP